MEKIGHGNGNHHFSTGYLAQLKPGKPKKVMCAALLHTAALTTEGEQVMKAKTFSVSIYF